MSSTTAVPWKSALMWVMAIIAAIAVAGWFAVSCTPSDANAERPVSEEEAALLAGMRQRNHDADPVAVRITVPTDGETVIADGYLDWRIPMLYARVPDGEGYRLVQAIPGLIATRAYDEAAFAELRVPEDGWTTRQMLSGASSPLETTIDILASSLFTLTAEDADDPAELAEKATWREAGIIDGEPVDSFRAPIMVETDGQEEASPEALYSLDAQGVLRRFQVNTGETSLSAVDFLREVGFDPSGLIPVDVLGGPVIEPSAVDPALAATIAEVRQRNWMKSATVDLTVPVADNEVATGTGSIDWRTMTAYLHVTDASGQRLLLARPGGYAIRPAEGDDLPETPPTDGWETHALGDDDAAEAFGPIESLVYRLLEMSAEEADDADAVAESAFLLRVDEATEGEPVQVVEFPVAGDAEADPGRSAYRYHLRDGRLAEVEMMSYFGVASAELAYEEFPMVEIPWDVSEAIG